MKKITFLFIAMAMAFSFTSCVTTHSTLLSSTPTVELKPEHLDITQPKEASAVTTRIFGVDWERLTAKRLGFMRGNVISSIPRIDRTEEYAIYSLLKQNEGYDMVMYPKFDKVVRKPVLGLGGICTITEVKVTARMAKLKF